MAHLIGLAEGEINASSARRYVARASNPGGVVTFEGVTRFERDEEHGDLTRLIYEAYRPMAERQLALLAEEARRRWPIQRLVILHRLGEVRVGETSVLIIVACAHRAEAFEACRWLIDSIKKDVPIWKKDVYADGFVRWVDPQDGTKREE